MGREDRGDLGDGLESGGGHRECRFCVCFRSGSCYRDFRVDEGSGEGGMIERATRCGYEGGGARQSREEGLYKFEIEVTMVSM